jgi:hypothetical protein
MGMQSSLPAVIAGASLGSSLLAEGSTLAKWDAEKGWHDRDGGALPGTLIVLGTRTGVRRWSDKTLVEEFVEQPLPDIEALNAQVPVGEWEIGFSGKPESPYRVWFAAYLLDPVGMTLFSYLNNTVGSEIAVKAIQQKLDLMQALHGGSARPVVKLADAPMKTKNFGLKRRPDFRIIEWRSLHADAPVAPQLPAPETQPTEIIDQPVKPSVRDDLNDEIPF